MAQSQSEFSLTEKLPRPDAEMDGPELEHGHLKELEVDVAKVLGEGGEHSIEEDTSPYPEGDVALSLR